MRTHTLLLVMLGLRLGTAGWVMAQEPPPEAEPTLVKPPKLQRLIPAALPPETVFPAPEVLVDLEIDVDPAGKVEQVRVVVGAGEPFDSAALSAAREFEFEPALLSTGENVPVTITFRMRISQPVAPAPQETAKPAAEPATAPAVRPVKFSGVLLERGTRKPLANVEVAVSAASLEPIRATTDTAGRFTVEVPALNFEIVAFSPGHEPLRVTVEAQAGEEREERYTLESAGSGFETVVRAEAVRREVTRQIIPKAVVEKVPGTQGDTLKVVQNLPGVARASFGAGQLVLRGASPGDSRVFLEGQEIPTLYHFGGLRSTFNSAFLEEVQFIPGNFGPDYGRAIGGVVDVQVRDPVADMFRGNVDLNLYDAGFVLEGPLAEGWSLGGAFHRSYIDTLLPLFLPDDAPLSFNTAPRYYDYQLLLSYRPDAQTRLRALFYGSLDRVRVLFARPLSDPVLRGPVDARIMFHNLQLGFESRVTPTLRQESSLAGGYQDFRTQVGPDLFFNLTTGRFAFRTAWTAELLAWIDLRVGLDLTLEQVAIDLNSPLRPIEGENSPPVSTQQTFAFRQDTTLYQPATFVELRLVPLPELWVLPSLRVDYYREIGRWTVDPRLAARYQAHEGTVLKGGVGYFQQPPTPDQSASGGGNPDLLAPRSTHSSLGVEQRLWEGIDLDLSVFYKWLDRQVSRNPAAFSNPLAPPYLNRGTGRILGVELLLKARVSSWFSGWLAYTFQRSFRKDAPGADERLFDFDQPHILTLIGMFELGAGWSGGLRFRLVSGNPYTPVAGTVYDAVSDTFVPVWGKTNTARQGTFHQLDIRFDKTWTFQSWKLGLYLDVLNLYNQKNPEGWSYNYDYTRKQVTSGLPILPLLGVHGEW